MKRYALLLFIVSSILLSCGQIDLFEKSVTIPTHEWSAKYKPVFDFDIIDTTANYKVFLVLRHTEKYNFNNIYVNLFVKGPSQDTATRYQKELILAANKEGWLGSGMDDIYEHRVLIAEQRFKAGLYQFTLEQIMREDPLQHILNVGIRIEKDH